MTRHRSTILRAVLAALCLAVPAQAQAKTLHLDVASKAGHCKDGYSVAQAARAKTPWCSIKRALNAAPPGSILDLRSGTYRSVSPTDMTRAPSKLTLRSHKGETAVVTQVRLTSCSKLAFRRLKLDFVRIEHCPGSSFVDDEVVNEGLWAFFSNDLKFVDNRIHDTDNGMILTQDKNVLVEGNDLSHVPRTTYVGDGGDGMQLQTVSNITVRKNVFHDFLSHAHTDAMEFAASNDRVTLDSNVFRSVRGIISVPHPVFKGPFSNTRWVIVNNEFVDLTQWAFELLNVPGARIVNNTAWDAGHGMRLHGDTTGVVMANNIADFVSADAAGEVGRSSGNVFGEVDGAYHPGSTDTIGMPTFVDAAAGNFQLAAGSLGIDHGSADVAPKHDQLGHARVGPPDSGAFELQPK
jgi:hypothetical protein